LESLNLNLRQNELEFNRIDLLPKNIEVRDASIWKKKDMTKVKDFKQIEIISDWSYSSTYKGSVRYLSNHETRLKEETTINLKS